MGFNKERNIDIPTSRNYSSRQKNNNYSPQHSPSNNGGKFRKRTIVGIFLMGIAILSIVIVFLVKNNNSTKTKTTPNQQQNTTVNTQNSNAAPVQVELFKKDTKDKNNTSNAAQQQ